MTRDRNDNLNNEPDKQYIKETMKEIKRAKKAGNEAKAQRLANELIDWLGFDR